MGECAACREQRSLIARGLCESCYRKHKRSGAIERFPRSTRPRKPCKCGCGQVPPRWGADYVAGHRPPKPMGERLTNYVVDEQGCWIWQGATYPNGYGCVGVPGTRRSMPAHRASYEVHIGPLRHGMFVCHACDVPLCINPAHLWLGTPQDNVDDMVRKDRGRALAGEESPVSRLTDLDVAVIRERYAPGVRASKGTGRSATELARQFGITPQYVSQLHRGKWRNG